MPKLLETTRAARLKRIMSAAVACFARQGYYGTTMEEIAAEAGIAKGAAYVYFPSKEAIFVALYDMWGCTVRERSWRRWRRSRQRSATRRVICYRQSWKSPGGMSRWRRRPVGY